MLSGSMRKGHAKEPGGGKGERGKQETIRLENPKCSLSRQTNLLKYNQS